MSVFAHLETLEEKHARLEDEISAETQRPLPDFTLITNLKKLKLRLKEQMEYLQHRQEQEHRNVS